MEKYLKTIEVLEERIISLEKELAFEKQASDAWFEEVQELKKMYEPQGK